MNQLYINTVKYLCLLILTCAQLSCKKSLLAEIPAYIEIHEFHYNNTNEEYDQSTKITDAWVTMDGQFLGAFELPCKIPIHSNQNEKHSFDIYPGIKVNGIAATRVKYPFYNKFEIDTTLRIDENIFLTPLTTYTEQASFQWNEGEGFFENEDNIILESVYTEGPSPILQNDVVFQGEKSLAIQLSDNYDYFEIRSSDSLQLTSTTTFLELNFKTSITLKVGLIIINAPYELKEELIQLYPTDNWKKIYLDLTPLIAEGTANSQFQIYFAGTRDPATYTNSVYIDNLQLVFPKINN